MHSTDICLAIQKYLPKRAEGALHHFVKTNPHMDGAQWADALHLMVESDAHCDLTEAIYGDLKPIVPLGTELWISPIFITLLYYNKGHVPYATEVAYYHGFVTGLYQRDMQDKATP